MTPTVWRWIDRLTIFALCASGASVLIAITALIVVLT